MLMAPTQEVRNRNFGKKKMRSSGVEDECYVSVTGNVCVTENRIRVEVQKNGCESCLFRVFHRRGSMKHRASEYETIDT